MDLVNIDGASFVPWKRPESPIKPGEHHEIEEVLLRDRFAPPEICLETAEIAGWKRAFLDGELHKMSPLVARVKDAVSRAKNISEDFKPDACQRLQEEALKPSLEALGEAAAKAIEQHVADWQRVETLAVQLPEPPKEGNAGVIYHLQATEVRTILRTMKPEARETYVRNQVKLGNITPLQACVSAPDAILSKDVLDSIRRDRIREIAPFIDAWRSDMKAIAAQAYKTCNMVFGAALSGVRRAFPAQEIASTSPKEPAQRLELKLSRPAALQALSKYELILLRSGRVPDDGPDFWARRTASLQRAARSMSGRRN